MTRSIWTRLALMGVALMLVLTASAHAAKNPLPTIRIGGKNFTEQEILSEIVAQAIERSLPVRVERRLGLGGTDVCHAALLRGEIDGYVEYTGSGLVNILKREPISDAQRAFMAVASAYRDRFDLEWLPPLGFNNTYAIAVRAEDADAHGWRTISDLAATAAPLEAGFTSEFIERPDGLRGLADTYALSFARVRDLDPGLMYAALAEGEVDVICAFSTDGRIDEYDLRLLEDDRAYFPRYDAAPVFRAQTLERFPAIRDALAPLASAITDDDMRAMNYAVDVLRRTPREVAAAWVEARLGPSPASTSTTVSVTDDRDDAGFFALFWQRRAEVVRKTIRHLWLTLLGVGIAIAIGAPLGALAQRVPALRGPTLSCIEIVQTIPSLAMLAFLFALYGLLGPAPAVTALVLYAILPITLNTFTGLREIPPHIIEAANGVGMSGGQRLRFVEAPLALPFMIAGVRAATVQTVGIATLSTYIGAGGLGDFIARGLARNDPRLTLLGAAPAALLAILLSLSIRAIERALRRA